jgi:hypothetical protein
VCRPQKTVSAASFQAVVPAPNSRPDSVSQSVFTLLCVFCAAEMHSAVGLQSATPAHQRHAALPALPCSSFGSSSHWRRCRLTPSHLSSRGSTCAARQPSSRPHHTQPHSRADHKLPPPPSAAAAEASVAAVDNARAARLAAPVVVVGGGPAGLAAALMLARRGYTNVKVGPKARGRAAAVCVCVCVCVCFVACGVECSRADMQS